MWMTWKGNRGRSPQFAHIQGVKPELKSGTRYVPGYNSGLVSCKTKISKKIGAQCYNQAEKCFGRHYWIKWVMKK